MTYQKGNTDLGLWLSLTKCSLKPKILIKSLNLYTLKSLFKSLLLTKNQTLKVKRWKLWAPTPTIATHIKKRYLSPTMDWDINDINK